MINWIRKVFVHSPVKYLAALIACTGICVFMLVYKGFDRLMSYVDAFSVSGALVLLFGLLVMVAYFGAFDTFGYSFSTLGKRRYKDMYEYNLAKAEKRAGQKYSFVPYMTVGAIFLITGIVLHMILNSSAAI